MLTRLHAYALAQREVSTHFYTDVGLTGSRCLHVYTHVCAQLREMMGKKRWHIPKPNMLMKMDFGECADMCIDMRVRVHIGIFCFGVLMDMCIDTCAHAGVDMCADVDVDMCTHAGVDMCAHAGVDMCADVGVDMCADMRM